MTPSIFPTQKSPYDEEQEEQTNLFNELLREEVQKKTAKKLTAFFAKNSGEKFIASIQNLYSTMSHNNNPAGALAGVNLFIDCSVFLKVNLKELEIDLKYLETLEREATGIKIELITQQHSYYKSEDRKKDVMIRYAKLYTTIRQIIDCTFINTPIFTDEFQKSQSENIGHETATLDDNEPTT